MPPRSARVIKLACKYNNTPHLFEFDQDKPLPMIIDNVLPKFQLADAAKYAFKLEDGAYITEKNREELKNGSILLLTLAPKVLAEDSIQNLRGRDPQKKRTTLTTLRTELKQDVSFAHIFMEMDGFPVLSKQILDNISEKDSEDNLGYGLMAYYSLLEHGALERHPLDSVFITSVIGLISTTSNPTVLQATLRVASFFLAFSSDGYNAVHAAVSFDKIVEAIKGDERVCEAAVHFVNQLVLNASQFMHEAVLRSLLHFDIVSELIKRVKKGGLSKPLALEMANFLHLWLSQLHPRRNDVFDPTDPFCVDSLQDLRAPLGDHDIDKGKNGPVYVEQWARLGFTDPRRPELEFSRPPGVLALTYMAYFARRYKDTYAKIVLEQLSRSEEFICPVARCSVALTDLLLDILRVGYPLSNPEQYVDTRLFYLFYSTENFFHELYCVSIQVLCKTWREMEAQHRDLDKVMLVVRKQLRTVLERRPDRLPQSFEMFKADVFQFQYSDVVQSEVDAMLELETNQHISAPVKAFRTKRESSALNKVSEQCLVYLCQGAWFLSNQRRKGKEKYMFCMLSPNHKLLHYSDEESEADLRTVKLISELPNQIAITEISQLMPLSANQTKGRLFGTEGGGPPQYGFGLLLEGNPEPKEFVTLSSLQASVWRDGIRVLLHRDTEEPETRDRVAYYLKMETTMRLLNLHGVALPASLPSIPPPPPDYNFTYASPSEHTLA